MTLKQKETDWTMQEALLFIREYQPRVMQAGWCLMLGGGVLNRGYGKDLDILAYPSNPAAVIDDAIALMPQGGTWASATVASIYCFTFGTKPVELIFQTHIPEGF